METIESIWDSAWGAAKNFNIGEFLENHVSIHVFWVFIAFVACTAGSVIYIVSYYLEKDEVRPRFFRRNWRRFKVHISPLPAILILTWWVAAGSQTTTVNRVVEYDTTDVIYPDGQTIQMFAADGKYHNANVMFKGVIPKGAKIRRTYMNREYLGINFGGGSQPEFVMIWNNNQIKAKTSGTEEDNKKDKK